MTLITGADITIVPPLAGLSGVAPRPITAIRVPTVAVWIAAL